MDDDKIANLIKNNSEIIKSNIRLQGSSKSVNINDTLEKIIITLNINSINNKTMNITKSKIAYIL